MLDGADIWKVKDRTTLYDYGAIRRRVDIYRDRRARGDDHGLLFALNEGIHGNMGGMGHAELYKRATFGTKELINAYVDEINAGIVNGPASQKLTLNPDGTIAVIRSNFINAASVDSNGFDIQASYTIDTDRAGQWRLFWNSSHIEKYKFQESLDGPEIDGLGKRNFQTIGAPAPKFRANFGLDWLRGNHNATVTLRYTDSYEMSRPPSTIIAQLNGREPSPEIDDYLTVDVQYGYQFQELFGSLTPTLTFGAINLFNESPPTIDDGPGYDSKIHDPRGLILYGRIKVAM